MTATFCENLVVEFCHEESIMMRSIAKLRLKLRKVDEKVSNCALDSTHH